MRSERLVRRVAAGGFGAAAAVRRGRAVHRVGVGYRARVALAAPFARLWDADEVDGIVRLSRGAGLPDPLPDVLGIGVRLSAGPGREADLLLASSAPPPVLRHVLWPGRRFDRAWFSSLTPVRLDGDLRLYGARLAGPPAVTLASLRRRATVPGPIEVSIATLSGGWEPAATVHFRDWLDGADTEDLALDPWHATVPLEPIGAFNRVRGAAYAASRRARGVPDPADLTGGSPPWRA